MSDKISAIITSGGSSTRFGANKLLEKIDDLSVIEVTVSKFIDLVDEIIIPTKEDIKEHLLKSKFYCNKICFAQAGSTRQESVYNGLLACNNPQYVLIHDGARPFIDCETIKKTIELVKEKRAVVVGVMATDTIKRVKDGKIIETIDRNEIFQAQTPQAFDYQLIKKANENVENIENLTDDSSIAQKYGIDVHYLIGSTLNKKITPKEDLY